MPNPDGRLAVAGSCIPFSSPMVIFARAGTLMHGKRPSLLEVARMVRRG